MGARLRSVHSKNCGILENYQQGDVVLCDRRFTIGIVLPLKGAELVTLPF